MNIGINKLKELHLQPFKINYSSRIVNLVLLVDKKGHKLINFNQSLTL